MNTKFLENIEKIHSRYTNDLAPFVYGLAKAIKPIVVVETGTCQGYMTSWLALNALEQRSKFYTIDWYKEEWPHASPGSWENVKKNLDSCGVLEGVTEIKIGDALETLKKMGKVGQLKDLGLCVLDDYHEYKYLCSEINTVYPYLIQGGIILIHDAHHLAMSEIATACCDSIRRYNARNIWLFNSLGYCVFQKNWV